MDVFRFPFFHHLLIDSSLCAALAKEHSSPSISHLIGCTTFRARADDSLNRANLK